MERDKNTGIQVTPLKKHLESFEDSDPITPRVPKHPLQTGSIESLPKIADLGASERFSAPTSTLVSPRKPSEISSLKEQGGPIQDRITMGGGVSDLSETGTDRGPYPPNQVPTFLNSKSSGSMKIGSNNNNQEGRAPHLGEKIHVLSQIVHPTSPQLQNTTVVSEPPQSNLQINSTRRFQKAGSGSNQLNHSFERVGFS